MIDDEGVYRTETMISLGKHQRQKRLMHTIFKICNECYILLYNLKLVLRLFFYNFY
jgi:hypothetical protein